jgi:hypothetical protein
VRLVIGERSWNQHVYEACVERGVAYPDIPVPAVELYAQAGEDVIVRALLEARALLEGVDLRQEHYLSRRQPSLRDEPDVPAQQAPGHDRRHRRGQR